MTAPTPRRRSAQGAFTLVEMLVVLAIISILSALSIYAIQGLLGSNSISGAGQHLQEIVSEARQSAITHSNVVELRLYKETGGTNYNGYQLVLYNSDGSVNQRLTKPQFFPQGIVISGDSVNNSTLLSINSTTNEATDGSDPTESPVTAGLTYVPVRFGASGGLRDATPQQYYYYYLLVVPQNGNLANKVVLTVDPVSGITQYSRP